MTDIAEPSSDTGFTDTGDPDAPTETTMHQHGSYRRRIRLVNEPGLVRGGLEDDFHYFRVAVRHDGSVVTGVEVEAFRWPWTTCPDAGNQLQLLVGMPLSPRCLAVGDHANPRLQCTHQFDLTGLAIAHATRDEHARQYDADVPYGTGRDGSQDVRLWRDGELALSWTIEGFACVAPEPYASVPWRGGFLRWADEHLDPDTAEAAIVLRRAAYISPVRFFDLDRYERPGDVTPIAGQCFTYTDGAAQRAERQIGSKRDYTHRPEALLAEAPTGSDRA